MSQERSQGDCRIGDGQNGWRLMPPHGAREILCALGPEKE